MQEIWKDIKGYEGLYEISNFGNVSSLKFNHTNSRKNIKPFINGGYNRVVLYLNGKPKKFLVHRLVAETFIPNAQNKPFVNHIDGNKKNNRVSNLEWVTASENTIHAIKNNLRPPDCPHEIKAGKEHPASKPIVQLDLNGKFVKNWGCSKDIEKELGFKHQFILRCCRKERKTYKGYIWRFLKK